MSDFVAKNEYSKLTVFINANLALILSLFVILTPWAELRSFEFYDLINYVHRYNALKEYGLVLGVNKSGIIGFLVTEGLWGQLLLFLGSLNLEAEVAMSIISFVCYFTISIFVLSNSRIVLGMILLLNPLLLDLVLSQQRSALAFSIFILSVYFRHRGAIFYALSLASVFVHTSAFLLYFFYFISLLFARKNYFKGSLNNRITLASILIILTVFILLSKDFVLALLGDRRADMNEGGQSILYASIWFLILACLIFFYKKKNDWMVYFSISFLLLFIVSTLLGLYSSRYLALAYPYFIISFQNIVYDIRIPMLLIFSCYFIFQWIYWLQI